MEIAPTQAALVATVLAAFGFVWYREGRGRWRRHLADRLLYGVPWGTAVTVGIIVAFYLFVQGGIRHWNEPLTLPFVTWSYFYPTGLLTAGIAHGSPDHLASNMAGTIVFGPIAEYAWGHYPPDGRDGEPGDGSLRSRPWVRALVAVPGALLAAAFVTAVFGLGPGLGFSGAVFAIAGFTVVTAPVPAIVAVVASSTLRTLYDALRQPVIRETIDPGAPGPPAWAGIGFQAHLLGFLLGVTLGVALLSHRGRRPRADRVFFATVLVGTAQALWLLVWTGGDDVYYLYQGAGVALVFLLSVLIAVAATARDRPLSRLSQTPTRRQTAVACLAVVAVLVALPSVPLNLFVVADGSVPGAGGVDVGEYTVTYEENASSGRTPVVDPDGGEEAALETRQSGVIVVNDDREMWAVPVRAEQLEYDGNASVEVGAVGWRETVNVERTGWDVVGNESAYVVDLTVDDETTRSFESEPIRTAATVDDHAIEVVPTDEEFQLRVQRGGSTVGTAAIPTVNETVTVGDLRVSTTVPDEREAERVVAAADGTEVPIAERETYADD
ncbi:rhomboid family intramembrane serine protease [Halopiger djelfimassiliensis]|uniref:rhomboid family intramembrane serine protease n=1 Tax=Halopiger djelfimassiliensis TaxID=1293047 RepID=UPI00067801BE|nr:rhomboid family intramembrane serine protease [Halopiger djelfimassiliensis]